MLMKTANLVRRYEYLTGSFVVYLPRSVNFTSL